MPRLLFDTNYLVTHWNKFPEKQEQTESSMREWAQKLIEQHQTPYVCTPVLIEMYAGTVDSKDLALHKAYLAEFRAIDDQNIPPVVWREALRISKRINPNRSTKRRHFADCLIKAIADHFRYEVLTNDQEMRRFK